MMVRIRHELIFMPTLSPGGEFRNVFPGATAKSFWGSPQAHLGGSYNQNSERSGSNKAPEIYG